MHQFYLIISTFVHQFADLKDDNVILKQEIPHVSNNSLIEEVTREKSISPELTNQKVLT